MGNESKEVQTTIQRIRVEIAKLQAMTEDVAAKMCDHYCRFPREVEDEDLMAEICDECPLNKLM